MITIQHLRNAKTDKPYRKTLEHGFSLQQAIDWRMGQVLNGLDPDKRSDNTRESAYIDMYSCAFLPPNYPMPAIRTKVVFASDGIELYIDQPEYVGCYIFYPN